MRVTAIDADGNEVSTDVPICIGGGCPETGDGDGDGDPTGDGDGDGDAEGETAADAGLDAGGDDGGCAVSRPRELGGTVALVVLGLFGALGYRRRR